MREGQVFLKDRNLSADLQVPRAVRWNALLLHSTRHIFITAETGEVWELSPFADTWSARNASQQAGISTDERIHPDSEIVVCPYSDYGLLNTRKFLFYVDRKGDIQLLNWSAWALFSWTWSKINCTASQASIEDAKLFKAKLDAPSSPMLALDNTSLDASVVRKVMFTRQDGRASEATVTSAARWRFAER